LAQMMAAYTSTPGEEEWMRVGRRVSMDQARRKERPGERRSVGDL